MGGWTELPEDMFSVEKLASNVRFQAGMRAARAGLSKASSAYDSMTQWLQSEWTVKPQPVLVHSTHPSFPKDGRLLEYTRSLIARLQVEPKNM